MNTESAPQQNPAGKRYRFVVRSAEEAVSAIREQLGETARVVSVRQVEGEGLTRFLKSPRLEVIAEVPEAPQESRVSEPAPSVPKASRPAAEKTAPPASAAPTTPPVPATAKRSPGETEQAPSPVVKPAFSAVLAAYAPQEESPADPPPAAKAPEPPAPTIPPMRPKAPRSRPSIDSPDRFWNVLERAGCSARFLNQFRGEAQWQELASKPLAAALPRAALLLRNTLAAVPVRPLTSRIAFFGTAGAGATTALCKQLVRDVFFSGRSACVMKLEGSRSNPAEGLVAFCEALSVPFLRSTDELAAVPADHRIYFDVPSLTLSKDGNMDLHRLLDEFEVTSRVLVVNAAYDVDLIKAAFGQADQLRARHVVFSHVDELTRWGKLWEFVAEPKRTTLFASSGQNLGGDCVRDMIDLLTQRTLHSAGD